MKVSGCDLAGIGGRIKAARDSLGLSQDGLALAVGVSKRGIQSNERQISVPGGEVICGMVHLGINANWLLTGEGPMLLADLVDATAERRQVALIRAFDEYWGSLEREMRREVAAADFQEVYNAGRWPRIPGIESVRASDVLASYQAQQPAPPAPAEIDQELLALCIEGVRINAGPNDSAAHQAKMVMEFYRRFLDMRTAKPAAA